jgi:hypothetical protein
LEFERVDFFGKRGELCVEMLKGRRVRIFGDLEKAFELLVGRRELDEKTRVGLKGFELLDDRRLLVAAGPEVGAGYLVFELTDPRAKFFDIKETSPRLRVFP